MPKLLGPGNSEAQQGLRSLNTGEERLDWLVDRNESHSY